MRSILFWSACALIFCLASASDAAAQCGGGRGGQTTGSTTLASGTATSTGQLLTGPGSWAYDVALQSQMQRVMLQRQSALAAQEAREDAERDARRKSTWTQRRASEVMRRQARREEALAAANR